MKEGDFIMQKITPFLLFDKEAEQAAKQAEADKKKQASMDEAANKVRAAEAAYQAELAKTGTTK